MTAIMQSIKPKECEFIISGEQTIIVQKTRPKCNTPFKVYIYCTKPRFPKEDFILKGIEWDVKKAFYAGGKVIGEYICREVWVPVVNYDNRKTFYAWQISNLKIYNTPKALSDFQLACNHKNDCCTCKRWHGKEFACIAGLKRPPQSWYYVEEV